MHHGHMGRGSQNMTHSQLCFLHVVGVLPRSLGERKQDLLKSVFHIYDFSLSEQRYKIK